jgi:hypothetical protein
MFPQSGPQTGNGFTTSSILQQNTGLLGNTPFSGGAAPAFDPGVLNSTAPQSSSTNPAVAHMVQALKGGA